MEVLIKIQIISSWTEPGSLRINMIGNTFLCIYIAIGIHGKNSNTITGRVDTGIACRFPGIPDSQWILLSSHTALVIIHSSASLISSRSQRIYTSAMKQTLEMVWRHSEGQAGPCMRCTDTGKTFLELLKELLPVFDDEGIRLDFREELVPPGTAVPINHLRLNGIPLHVLLSRAAEGEEYCHASKCMPLKNFHRQVRGPDGITCDEAPEMIVRKAILLALEEEPGSGDQGRA